MTQTQKIRHVAHARPGRARHKLGKGGQLSECQQTMTRKKKYMIEKSRLTSSPFHNKHPQWKLEG
jgi:hypothetical protein